MASIKERTEIAKANPRDVKAVLNEVENLSTISEEIALSCFYVIIKDKKPFVGISVRLAELVASSWGNIHSGARIINKNDKEVTVQGFVHDFQKNSVFTVEIQRPIFGMTAEQSINNTSAASSIAFRNAVFKAIPASLISSIVDNIKHYVLSSRGNTKKTSRVNNTIEYFKSKGVTSSHISFILGKNIVFDAENTILLNEDLFLLIGIKNAIEEGDTTIDEVFKIKGDKIKKPSRFNFSTEDDDFKNEDGSEIMQPEDLMHKILEVKESVDLKSSISSLKQSDVSKNKLANLKNIEPKDEPILKKRKRGRPPKELEE
tara:strand:- start:457 stop:1407 length:951 start_codon:yes stop_codon:yes gene_type:complete